MIRQIGNFNSRRRPSARSTRSRVSPSPLDCARRPHQRPRSDIARLLASADGLVHGCESRHSASPSARHGQAAYRCSFPIVAAPAGNIAGRRGPRLPGERRALADQVLSKFTDETEQLRSNIAASLVRTMDEHFSELFAAYSAIATAPVAHASIKLRPIASAALAPIVKLARSRSSSFQVAATCTCVGGKLTPTRKVGSLRCPPKGASEGHLA